MLGCCALDFSVLRCGHMVGFCEHGNESYGFIKLWGLLQQLRDSQILKNDSLPCIYQKCA